MEAKLSMVDDVGFDVVKCLAQYNDAQLTEIVDGCTDIIASSNPWTKSQIHQMFQEGGDAGWRHVKRKEMRKALQAVYCILPQDADENEIERWEDTVASFVH